MKRHLKDKFVYLTKNTKSMIVMNNVEDLFNYYIKSLNSEYYKQYYKEISNKFYNNIKNNGYYIIDTRENDDIIYYINMNMIKDIINNINDERINERIKKLV